MERHIGSRLLAALALAGLAGFGTGSGARDATSALPGGEFIAGARHSPELGIAIADQGNRALVEIRSQALASLYRAPELPRR